MTMHPDALRREADRLDSLLASNDVREAMALRCAEQGHDEEPGVTAWLQLVHICRWCGARR